ncbi:DUF6919 domain-containing protein [Streptomyces sp. NPDC012794]|uniref:DUF6919 domain-containing protein n=1 Tax=Streptomyces sp. NPDC012794 TaxID=3364850 RepID=UPI0036919293
MGSVWRDARSITDLGQHMAAWLEGRLPSWPGYHGPFGQEETDGARHLIPVLAAANRAGYVTTCSQPACDEVLDGVRWRQRAWVEGVVDKRSPLLRRLEDLAGRGFTVVHGWPRAGYELTTRDGRAVTGIGGFRMRRNDVVREWRGVGHQAIRDLKENGVRIHLIDLTYGRDDRLWPALANAIR